MKCLFSHKFPKRHVIVRIPKDNLGDTQSPLMSVFPIDREVLRPDIECVRFEKDIVNLTDARGRFKVIENGKDVHYQVLPTLKEEHIRNAILAFLNTLKAIQDIVPSQNAENMIENS